MATVIRPELSKKNEHHISKHRFYELKHFVQQYPEWNQYLRNFDGRYSRGLLYDIGVNRTEFSNPTEEEVEKRELYFSRIALVKECLLAAFHGDRAMHRVEAWKWTEYDQAILDGIINGKSYDVIKARCDIPYSKELYYRNYHRFFWMLDQARK